MDNLQNSEELIFGLMAPIGANLKGVKNELKKQLGDFRYEVEEVKLSDFIIKKFESEENKNKCEFCLKRNKISYGTKIRSEKGDSSILAKYAIKEIYTKRKKNKGTNGNKVEELKRIAYIVDQIKRKEEINILEETYGKSFFLIGVNCPTQERLSRLSDNIDKSKSYAQQLIELDEDESKFFSRNSSCNSCKPKQHLDEDKVKKYGQHIKEYGQHIKEIFHKSDIFIPDGEHKKYIKRLLDLIFGSPDEFPTHSEHAMYMAFSTAIKSADLSRQVGAVISSKSGDFISVGANDVPCAGGGVYEYGNHKNDSHYGFEPNSKERYKISEEVLDCVRSSLSDGSIDKIILDKIFNSDKSKDKLLKETRLGSMREVNSKEKNEILRKILDCIRSSLSDEFTNKSELYYKISREVFEEKIPENTIKKIYNVVYDYFIRNLLSGESTDKILNSDKIKKKLKETISSVCKENPKDENTILLKEVLDCISSLLRDKFTDKSKDKFLAKKLLAETRLGSITEFHRTVHAEMQAILSATRSGISPIGSTMYVTTFPCHNCTKHIIASGIENVVYVEPYPKSLAQKLHQDSIELTEDGQPIDNKKVNFRPFFGIGPRRFKDLFSQGERDSKKDDEGTTREYSRRNATMKFNSDTYPFKISYQEKEEYIIQQINEDEPKPDEREVSRQDPEGRVKT